MIVTENASGYTADELFGIAERENNSKRRNLIVNLHQGKHVPAVPSETLKLFAGLADKVRDDIVGGVKTIVIGFAETATAIGAAVAANLGADCIYIHTSREKIAPELCVADFSEEHSHAAEQYLFSEYGDDLFREAANIIFVEDELTTGRTILNFIKVLQPKVDEGCHFYAASVINGMSSENIEVYESMNIGLYSLVKLDSSISELNEDLCVLPENDCIPDKSEDFTVLKTDGKTDPRLGCSIKMYDDACMQLCGDIYEKIRARLANVHTIDVIGTEECMYPAIRMGDYLEKLGYSVTTHSTTRSPIVPSAADEYPLFMRCRLRSFYDRERVTFIYNLYECDMTLLITDTPSFDMVTAAELASVLKSPEKIMVNWKQTAERISL